MLKGLIASCLILLAAQAAIAVDEKNFTEALFRSTFKLENGNSCGTGFIVGKRDPKNPERLFYVLVTANHVLADPPSETLTIVLRRRSGETFERLPHTIRIRNNGMPLWTQAPSLDLAAMVVSVPKAADIHLIGTEFLATDETLTKLEVHAGDELSVLGFPYCQEANSTGFAILRSGRIASYPIAPAEKVPSFLLDFEVFGGNSGGPVFIDQRIRASGGGAALGQFYAIMGLVSAERVMNEKIESRDELRLRKHKLGLALVMQATHLSKLIDSLPIPDSAESP